MKTPIAVADIKAGDTIRVEWTRSQCGSPRALEYVALVSNMGMRRKMNASEWDTAQHYLLDRPAPPKLLPEGVNLGWAKHHYHGSILSFWEEKRYSNGNHRFDQTHPDGHHAAQAVDFDGFIPATAVPTEALEQLRGVARGCSATYPDYENAIRDFLAAITKATQ